MTGAASRPSLFHRPDGKQRLLLQAAAAGGEAAVRAWADWRRTADIERLDHGSYGLLPQAWANLQGLGVRDDWFPRMQGVYRLTAVKNCLYLHCLEEMARRCADRKLSLLAVGGTALLLSCHPDPGLYPMSALSLFVREEEAAAFAEILAGAGWKARRADWRADIGRTRGVRFERQDGLLLRLYWRDALLCDRDLPWSSTAECLAGAATMLVPAPPDLLIRILLQGAVWNDDLSFRWAADAATLLRSAPPGAWRGLQGKSQGYRRNFLLGDMLRFLGDVLPGCLPEDFPAAAAESRAGWKERRMAGALAKPPVPGFWPLLARWDLYSGVFAERTFGWRLRHFPAYQAAEWDLAGWRRIPAYIWRRRRRHGGPAVRTETETEET